MQIRKYFVYLFLPSVGLIVSAVAQAQDAAKPHELGGDACGYCHSRASSSKPAAPLWNRGASATSSFTMYDSPSMKMAATGQPQGISLLCLSCHNGATSQSVVLEYFGSNSSGVIAGNSLAIGHDGLANDHPISIVYSTALNTELNEVAAGKVGNLPLYRAPGGGPVADQVECVTCHDPHDATFDSYLRMDNTKSALCLTCHIK